MMASITNGDRMGFWWDLTIIVGGFMGYWLSRICKYGDMIWHDWETMLDSLTKGSGLALLCPPGLLRIQQPTIHGIPTNHGSGAVWHTSPLQAVSNETSFPIPWISSNLRSIKYQMIPNGIWCLDILSTTPIQSYPLHRNHLNHMDLRLVRLPPLGWLFWWHPSRAIQGEFCWKTRVENHHPDHPLSISILLNGIIQGNGGMIQPEVDQKIRADPQRVVRGFAVLVFCPVVGHVALQPTVRTP